MNLKRHRAMNVDQGNTIHISKHFSYMTRTLRRPVLFNGHFLAKSMKIQSSTSLTFCVGNTTVNELVTELKREKETLSLTTSIHHRSSNPLFTKYLIYQCYLPFQHRAQYNNLIY